MDGMADEMDVVFLLGGFSFCGCGPYEKQITHGC